MTYFPRLPGCQPLPRMHIPPLHSSLSPISGVPPLTSGRRLTSERLASPHFPGCHSQSHIDISPRKRLFPPTFRGARPCLICTSHLWHSSLFPISGVPLPASHQHLTTQTSPPPAFRGAPLCHTDLGHLSLRNYFCGAENAQDFLRRR